MNKARIEAAKELVRRLRKKKHKKSLALLQEEPEGEPAPKKAKGEDE